MSTSRESSVESTAPRTAEWEPPGPGSWSFDATHCTRPLDRFTEGLLVEPYAEGFRRGMRTIGSPLETIELATVNGWVFNRVKPLGGPDEPSGGPPPKLLMTVLFALHPELRRRHRTARRFLVERDWEPIVAAWESEVRPRFRCRLGELGRADPATLDDRELAGQVERAAETARDAAVNHFANAPVVAVVVGELLCLSTEHGLTGSEAMSTLAGHSAPVTEATKGADRLVAALAECDGMAALDGPPDTLFARIAEVGPGPEAELDRYLASFGAHLAGGETVADPTVAECPDVVQALLRRRADDLVADDGREGSAKPRTEADAAVERLGSRIPAEVRPRWIRAVADARIVAPLRDDDALPLVEAMGRSRLALLEVGRRLVARGIADRADDAVELAVEEVATTLAGAGVTARELRRRVAVRRERMGLVPPDALGPEGGPPPLDRFPAAVARLSVAVGAFVERFDAAGDGPTEAGAGHGVSTGVVIGRARVIPTIGDLGRMEPGDILVTRTTSPSYNSVLAIAGGVVTETGGSICHAAVMARELGIPAVVGYADALSIPDGATVRVDGDRGTVEILP